MPVVNSYINNSQLFHDLKSMGRNNFSYNGAMALMEYLDELSEDIGENIEYDPVAFCCDYAEYCPSEYVSLSEEYGEAPKRSEFEEDEENEFFDALKDWLQDQTTVIEFDSGIIIQEF